MEQISPNIIERSVQSVGECQIVGGRQFQHLRYILKKIGDDVITQKWMMS
jgi:hypothetical protein